MKASPPDADTVKKFLFSYNYMQAPWRLQPEVAPATIAASDGGDPDVKSAHRIKPARPNRQSRPPHA